MTKGGNSSLCINNNRSVEEARKGILIIEDDPATPQVNETEIMAENHYYPFGMNQEGPWYNVVLPKNQYLFNGIERNEDLGMNIDLAVFRAYDASLGRWWQIDTKAVSFAHISPYVGMGNNPIMIIDPLGDSINVAAIATAKPEEWKETLKELQEFTGLILSVDDSGNMTYTKPEGKPSGSKRARKMLMKAIDHKETVTVKDNEGGGSRVNMDSDDPVEQNTIHLDFKQLSAFVKGTSSDLDPRAYGFGLNFFHELGHTRVGGRMLDGGHMVAGPNVQNINKISRQLGPSFGQRMVYNQFIVSGDRQHEYHAFSKSALRSLVADKIPTSGYIKVPR